MSYDDETKRRKEIIEQLVLVALVATVLTVLIGPIAYFLSTPFEDIEQQQAALDNSGYNWTEVNYTTFETKVDCGFFCTSKIAEEQCANGIQEACDYITIKNVDYHDRNRLQDSLWESGGLLFAIVSAIILITSPIWGLFLVLFIGDRVSKRLGWDN